MNKKDSMVWSVCTPLQRFLQRCTLALGYELQMDVVAVYTARSRLLNGSFSVVVCTLLQLLCVHFDEVPHEMMATNGVAVVAGTRLTAVQQISNFSVQPPPTRIAQRTSNSYLNLFNRFGVVDIRTQ